MRTSSGNGPPISKSSIAISFQALRQPLRFANPIDDRSQFAFGVAGLMNQPYAFGSQPSDSVFQDLDFLPRHGRTLFWPMGKEHSCPIGFSCLPNLKCRFGTKSGRTRRALPKRTIRKLENVAALMIRQSLHFAPDITPATRRWHCPRERQPLAGRDGRGFQIRRGCRGTGRSWR